MEAETVGATGEKAAPAEPQPTSAELQGEAETASPADVSVEPSEVPNIIEAPAVGVEIVSTEERHGTLYFTVRDLRTCGTVHNVTQASARKLWSYAINQCLKNPVDPEQGDLERGLWPVAGRTPGQEAALRPGQAPA